MYVDRIERVVAQYASEAESALSAFEDAIEKLASGLVAVEGGTEELKVNRFHTVLSTLLSDVALNVSKQYGGIAPTKKSAFQFAGDLFTQLADISDAYEWASSRQNTENDDISHDTVKQLAFAAHIARHLANGDMEIHIEESNLDNKASFVLAMAETVKADRRKYKSKDVVFKTAHRLYKEHFRSGKTTLTSKDEYILSAVANAVGVSPAEIRPRVIELIESHGDLASAFTVFILEYSEKNGKSLVEMAGVMKDLLEVEWADLVTNTPS